MQIPRLSAEQALPCVELQQIHPLLHKLHHRTGNKVQLLLGTATAGLCADILLNARNKEIINSGARVYQQQKVQRMTYKCSVCCPLFGEATPVYDIRCLRNSPPSDVDSGSGVESSLPGAKSHAGRIVRRHST